MRPAAADFRLYLFWIAASNLGWETAQLPLYGLWRSGSAGGLIFAVVHCTAGDVLIAAAALFLAITITRSSWSESPRRAALPLCILLGTAYTVFSEWLNADLRQSWNYSALMPTVPMLGTGISPLLQWLLLPPLCWRRSFARR